MQSTRTHYVNVLYYIRTLQHLTGEPKSSLKILFYFLIKKCEKVGKKHVRFSFLGKVGGLFHARYQLPIQNISQMTQCTITEMGVIIFHFFLIFSHLSPHPRVCCLIINKHKSQRQEPHGSKHCVVAMTKTLFRHSA